MYNILFVKVQGGITHLAVIGFQRQNSCQMYTTVPKPHPISHRAVSASQIVSAQLHTVAIIIMDHNHVIGLKFVYKILYMIYM
jgi:hypothetical protein